MDFDTAKAIVDHEILENDDFDEVSFEFFGGEPFLNFKLMKEVHDYLHSRPQNKKFICFTTTNGTLVHGDIKQWLSEHKNTFICGLSLDGTPEMHNTTRDNSFSAIDVDFFANTYPNQPIKMTINDDILPYLSDGIIFLLKKGFKVTPSFAQGVVWSGESSVIALERELKKLVDFYLLNPEYPIDSFINSYIPAINLYTSFEEKWCGCGNGMRAYFIDGNRYPCQCFTPLACQYDEQAFSLVDFKSTELFYYEKCDNCMYIPLCSTCYGNNYIHRGNMAKRDLSICELNKSVIKAAAYFQTIRLLDKKDLTDEDYATLKAGKLILNQQ